MDNHKSKKINKKLLLESIFPVFSGRMHSIPDVIGPLKFVIDLEFILLTIALPFALETAQSWIIFFQILSFALSSGITYGLYKEDQHLYEDDNKFDYNVLVKNNIVNTQSKEEVKSKEKINENNFKYTYHHDNDKENIQENTKIKSKKLILKK